jgi:hypothetical protein
MDNTYIRVPCPQCGHQLAIVRNTEGGSNCIHCNKKFKDQATVSKYFKKYLTDYKEKEKYYNHPIQYQLDMLTKAVMELKDHLEDEDLYSNWTKIEIDTLVVQTKKVIGTIKGELKWDLINTFM